MVSTAVLPEDVLKHFYRWLHDAGYSDDIDRAACDAPQGLGFAICWPGSSPQESISAWYAHGRARIGASGASCTMGTGRGFAVSIASGCSAACAARAPNPWVVCLCGIDAL